MCLVSYILSHFEFTGASKGVMNGTPEVLEIIHRGGENDEDIINILTVDGERIPAVERQTVEIPFI